MHMFWLRHDLRLFDNTAVLSAFENKGPVMALYIHCPLQMERHDEGEARQWFHLSHVQSLFNDLAAMNVDCHYFEVDLFEQVPGVIGAFCDRHHVGHVSFNREYGYNEQQRDHAVRTILMGQGVSVTSFEDDVVVPVASVTQKNGSPYKVFTPFKKAWLSQAMEGCRLAPSTVSGGKGHLYGQDVLTRRIKCVSKHLSAAVKDPWPVGEKRAQQQLQTFLETRVMQYHENRDVPSIVGTSRISPYLASGVVSPKHVFTAAMALPPGQGRDIFISELAWRDFYRHLMARFPHVAQGRAFHRSFDQIQWRDSPEDFDRWCHGQTGVPLVDAGMRELNSTGWMHNRLRMVTAMFLSKNLWLDWRLGEAYFMKKLLDGDYASNSGGWQWSASVGTDAAPYFRVFNPLAQAERFDPECDYIKRHVPELRNCSVQWILKADQFQCELTQAGYPSLMVDVKSSRQTAINLFKAFKNQA